MELSNCPNLQRPVISTYLLETLVLWEERAGRNTFQVHTIMLSNMFGQSGNCLWYNRHFQKSDIETVANWVNLHCAGAEN